MALHNSVPDGWSAVQVPQDEVLKKAAPNNKQEDDLNLKQSAPKQLEKEGPIKARKKQAPKEKLGDLPEQAVFDMVKDVGLDVFREAIHEIQTRIENEEQQVVNAEQQPVALGDMNEAQAAAEVPEQLGIPEQPFVYAPLNNNSLSLCYHQLKVLISASSSRQLMCHLLPPTN